jgi:hypothetical protein
MGQSMDQGMAQSVQPTPQEAKPTTRSEEMRIALQALSDTVKTENKIAQAVIGLQ